jgi:hypothetical protein
MIPAWNAVGVLPPIRPGKPGNDPDRSPYKAGLYQLAEHFTSTPERLEIINGLLAYRKALHGAGIVTGFQWLDGSFMEQVEALESRPPNDIDVVTFFTIPEGASQQTLVRDYGELFNQAKAKEKFRVDAYPFILGEPTTPYRVKLVSYWYSMWSHRRNGQWKGFIQVDLDPVEDLAAQKVLEVKGQEGGLP